jgi:hypothetical protein
VIKILRKNNKKLSRKETERKQKCCAKINFFCDSFGPMQQNVWKIAQQCRVKL